jgi:protein-tyrosine phosphatase
MLTRTDGVPARGKQPSTPEVAEEEIGSAAGDDGRVARHLGVETEFRLLYVCTGNICRSPFAEILTRHLLVGRLGGRAAAAFHVSSAGVQGMVGSAIHPSTRHELSPWGLHRAAADRFVARRLRSEMIGHAHLVLGANTRHRSAVIEYEPGALATSFSIREFARLAAEVDPAELPADPVARAHELVDQVRNRRGVSPPSLPDADRIPDPMGRPQQAHHEAATLIRDAVTTIVDVIAPPRTGRNPVR